MDDLTPMMKQYLEMKRIHKEEILFFRLGDFYEMFFDDAKTAARVLHLTLTARQGGQGQKVPMAGIPYHAAENYISKLVKQRLFHRHLRADRGSCPSQGSGETGDRPGHHARNGLSAAMLDEKSNNYLVALSPGAQTLGLAVVDVTTGEFKTCELTGPERFSVAANELSKFNPSEILLPQTQPDPEEWAPSPQDPLNGAKHSHMEDWKFSSDEGKEALSRAFPGEVPRRLRPFHPGPGGAGRRGHPPIFERNHP